MHPKPYMGASRRPRIMRGLIFLVLATPCLGVPFTICKTRTLEILKGNLEYNGIDQGNIGQYLYTGTVYGMNHEYARVHRENYPTLNLRGNKIQAKFSFQSPIR